MQTSDCEDTSENDLESQSGELNKRQYNLLLFSSKHFNV